MPAAKQQMGAGAAYRRHIKDSAISKEIVDVIPPSGFVFKFEKPSRFSMLFGSGQLPLAATNGAVEKWQQEGVGEATGSDQDQDQLIRTALTVRDKVLALSHTPKLVAGPAQNDNELSTDDVDDDDLDYLFKWVAAGGEVSAMLGTFPERSKPNTLASASRKKRRNPSE